ncbi:hypothetical protein SANTM175S_01380 [Streptomyces antimycoticus]
MSAGGIGVPAWWLIPWASPAVTYTHTTGTPERSTCSASGFMKYRSSSGCAMTCSSSACLSPTVEVKGSAAPGAPACAGPAGTGAAPRGPPPPQPATPATPAAPAAVSAASAASVCLRVVPVPRTVHRLFNLVTLSLRQHVVSGCSE